MTAWRDTLDTRQRTAVAFAESYAREFNHGAVSHNDLLLIARMAALLDTAQHAGATFAAPDRMDLPLGFGQYGRESIRQIVDHDPGYVAWLAREARDDAVRDAARRWMDSQVENEPEGTEEELPF